jgi:hypothetical protein
MNLRRWTAWAPGREEVCAWLAWASGADGAASGAEVGAEAFAPPPVKEIPPLLRRRADTMGRAVLHVLSRPELPYAGEPIVFCSRFGELPRSLLLQRELAVTGQVSPQHFSMSVHNATGGLFMMAAGAQAPLTALAAATETALAGLQEAQAQLADGAPAVWLVYGEEPLPSDYRPLSRNPNDHTDYFAILIELTPGADFTLVAQAPDNVNGAEQHDATPLDVLRFFLNPKTRPLRLSARGALACPGVPWRAAVQHFGEQQGSTHGEGEQ